MKKKLLFLTSVLVLSVLIPFQRINAQATTDYFILVYKVEAGQTLYFPAWGSCHFNIDWGDGVVEEKKGSFSCWYTDDLASTSLVSHTYTDAGTYEVKVIGSKDGGKGGLPRINYSFSSFKDANNVTPLAKASRASLVEIKQWGIIEWSSMQGAFCLCAEAKFTTSDKPNLSKVTNMQDMFFGVQNFPKNINDWDVSNVTNMCRIFASSNFNQPLDKWDVSNVTDMFAAFHYNKSFNQDLSAWKITSLTDAGVMFMKNDSLSVENYDKLLISWNNQVIAGLANKGVTFHGGDNYYCEGEDARSSLTGTHGWSITDKGKATITSYTFDEDKTSCPGESVTLKLLDSERGVTYTLYDKATNTAQGDAVNGTSSAITFNVSPSSTTSYYVVANNPEFGSTSCNNLRFTDEITVTVVTPPNSSYTFGDDLTICLDESATLTLSGSESDVTYTLYDKATDKAQGSAVSGTGSAITFSVSLSSTTSYYVVANKPSLGSMDCAERNLTDEITVTVVTPPNSGYIFGDDLTICLGESATLTLLDSESGVTYTLYDKATDTEQGSAVSGTGSAITFNVSPSSTTSYYVVANKPSLGSMSCAKQKLTDEITVTVGTPPSSSYTFDEDKTICLGKSATLTLSGSESDVTYTLYDKATDKAQGSAVSGTGSAITFSVSLSSTTSYYVVANKPSLGSMDCAERNLTDEITVTV
ncbi:MAG: BspA family leucine-rich repeat surface protein, partial [Bacteroidales bacterium]